MLCRVVPSAFLPPPASTPQEDTLRSGGGRCRPELVDALVVRLAGRGLQGAGARGAPRWVRKLGRQPSVLSVSCNQLHQASCNQHASWLWCRSQGSGLHPYYAALPRRIAARMRCSSSRQLGRVLAP